MDPGAQLSIPKVSGLKCIDVTSNSLTIVWDEPWNGSKDVEYLIWVHQSFREFSTRSHSFQLKNLQPKSEYFIWVRAAHIRPSDPSSPQGEYSQKLECTTL